MAGYDDAWVNEGETKDQMCAICLCVARNIVQHGCGASFCEVCFKQNQAAGRPCANCRGPDDAAAANRDRLAVQNLTIRCPSNCGATFRLGDKEKHLADKCPAIAAAAVATPKFAYVWIDMYAGKIRGAATLFQKDVGAAAVCDPQCGTNSGNRMTYSNVVGKACGYCVMDAAGRKGWEYIGEIGQHSHALCKRL